MKRAGSSKHEYQFPFIEFRTSPEFTMPKPSYTLEIATDGGRYMNVALARKRHERFCLHYMSTMNGSQSALAAGYSARNPKNAHIIAWTLLKREDAKTKLAAIMNKLSVRIAEAEDVPPLREGKQEEASG